MLENRPDTTETYGGLEIQLLKALLERLDAPRGLRLQRLAPAVGPGGIVNPNNEVPGTNANGPIVEGNINATWQFNVSGTVVLPARDPGGRELLRPPGISDPLLRRGRDRRQARQLSPLQIGSATAYRTPNVYVLDLQLSRDFRLGPRLTVTPTVAFFNLFDSRTVLSRDGFVGCYDTDVSPVFEPNGDFNSVASLSSRTIRGGVRISF